MTYEEELILYVQVDNFKEKYGKRFTEIYNHLKALKFTDTEILDMFKEK